MIRSDCLNILPVKNRFSVLKIKFDEKNYFIYNMFVYGILLYVILAEYLLQNSTLSYIRRTVFTDYYLLSSKGK